MPERRAYPRLRQRRRVGLILPGREPVHTWTYDISRGGLQVLCSELAEVGSEFEITLTPFDPEANAFREIRAFAEVIHVVYSGEAGRYRIGLRFVQISEEAVEILERFLEYQMRRYRGLG